MADKKKDDGLDIWDLAIPVGAAIAGGGLLRGVARRGARREWERYFKDNPDAGRAKATERELIREDMRADGRMGAAVGGVSGLQVGVMADDVRRKKAKK